MQPRLASWPCGALLKANETGTAGGPNSTPTKHGNNTWVKNSNSTNNAVSLAIGFLTVFKIQLNNATIFAPTDKALRALSMRLKVSVANILLKAPYLNSSLASLKYHASYKAAAGDGCVVVVHAWQGHLTKPGGTNLLVVDGKSSSAVLVGRSNIQWNGNVVHLVDKVLLP
ncbi:fasciclin domain [Haematococcus lacustris]|uniref:Fasciclin domain n=1 Tax=Haematococcus lacustris TaxID=44745 RepID=A0A699ZBI3_HAELA|nr:fasciclin domain [Haematococcus lacustris]